MKCPVDPYFIIPDRCICIDFQTLRLQESPDAVPHGEMPRHLQLYCDRWEHPGCFCLMQAQIVKNLNTKWNKISQALYVSINRTFVTFVFLGIKCICNATFFFFENSINFADYLLIYLWKKIFEHNQEYKLSLLRYQTISEWLFVAPILFWIIHGFTYCLQNFI